MSRRSSRTATHVTEASETAAGIIKHYERVESDEEREAEDEQTKEKDVDADDTAGDADDDIDTSNVRRASSSAKPSAAVAAAAATRARKRRQTIKIEVDSDEEEEEEDASPPLPTKRKKQKLMKHEAGEEESTTDEEEIERRMKAEANDGDVEMTDADERKVTHALLASSSAAAAASSLAQSSAASSQLAIVNPSPSISSRYKFADLSTDAARYTALMNGCPANPVLHKLIRLVAQPTSSAALKLVRDPLNAAKLFQASTQSSTYETTATVMYNNRNVRLCVELLKQLARPPAAASFLIRLTNAQLLAYETTLEIYLSRTGGVPPIDLDSMQKKLLASRVDRVPQRDEEGAYDAYDNGVAFVIQDLVTMIINSVKFNPPGHMIHTQALDFADRLLHVHLPSLRKTIKIDQDLEVCILCGSGSSEESHPLGLLMQCESCGFWYHQGCADVPQLPKESWYCSDCKIANPKLTKRTAKQQAAMQIQKQQPGKAATTAPEESPTSRSASPHANASASSTNKRHSRDPSPAPTSLTPTNAAPAASSSNILATTPTAAASSSSSIAPVAPASGSKRKQTPSEPTDDSVAKRLRTREQTAVVTPTIATTSATPPAKVSAPSSSPMPHSRPSPMSSLPPSSAAGEAAMTVPARYAVPRSGRVSPDGSWQRLIDFRVQDSADRRIVQPNPLTGNERGDDEPELRALRCDMDAAMKVLAGSNERLIELTRIQRMRAARQKQREDEIANSTNQTNRVFRILNAPWQAEVEEVRQQVKQIMKEHGPKGDAPAAAAAASSSSSSLAAWSSDAPAIPVHPALSAMEQLLSKFQQRHTASSNLLLAQSKSLAQAQNHALELEKKLENAAAELQQRDNEIAQQSDQYHHLIHQLRKDLKDERTAHAALIEQSNRQEKLFALVIQRLDRTVVGSPIPDQFGTKLVREMKQLIHTEELKHASDKTTKKQQSDLQPPPVIRQQSAPAGASSNRAGPAATSTATFISPPAANITPPAAAAAASSSSTAPSSSSNTAVAPPVIRHPTTILDPSAASAVAQADARVNVSRLRTAFQDAYSQWMLFPSNQLAERMLEFEMKLLDAGVPLSDFESINMHIAAVTPTFSMTMQQQMMAQFATQQMMAQQAAAVAAFSSYPTIVSPTAARPKTPKNAGALTSSNSAIQNAAAAVTALSTSTSASTSSSSTPAAASGGNSRSSTSGVPSIFAPFGTPPSHSWSTPPNTNNNVTNTVTNSGTFTLNGGAKSAAAAAVATPSTNATPMITTYLNSTSTNTSHTKVTPLSTFAHSVSLPLKEFKTHLGAILTHFYRNRNSPVFTASTIFPSRINPRRPVQTFFFYYYNYLNLMHQPPIPIQTLAQLDPTGTRREDTSRFSNLSLYGDWQLTDKLVSEWLRNFTQYLDQHRTNWRQQVSDALGESVDDMSSATTAAAAAPSVAESSKQRQQQSTPPQSSAAATSSSDDLPPLVSPTHYQ